MIYVGCISTKKVRIDQRPFSVYLGYFAFDSFLPSSESNHKQSELMAESKVFGIPYEARKNEAWKSAS